MSLTGKQVRALRSLAHHLDAKLYIGKNGVSESCVTQADDILEADELIKVAVQDSSGLSVKEAGQMLAEELGADIVQTIGHRFVIYRESSRDDIEHIEI